MFLRRRASDPEARERAEEAGQGAGTATKARTSGKGRPTPKRRDAERRRRRPVTAPRTRKEAYRGVKDRQREDRQRRREGVARGDERYLPARDKGPTRRLARDLVDSRRNVGEYFLYGMIAVIVLTFVPTSGTRMLAYYILWPIIMVAVIIDSGLLWRKVTRLARERYPDEDTRGLPWYAVTRALQIRRLRLPGPQVKVGEKV